MSYVIYKENGQIVSSVSCLQTAPDSVEEGCLILEDTFCSIASDYYVLNGELTPFPAKPVGKYLFNYATQIWEDSRSLGDAKLSKGVYINRARALANQTSFTYLGKQVACDALSRSDIDGVNGEVSLTGQLPANWPGGWKCMDNTYVAIADVATWVQFYQAMTAQGTANFSKAQQLKAAVASSTTIVEVDAVVW